MNESHLAAVLLPSSSEAPFLDTWSTSELVEMVYQMGLFAVGTPLNAVALVKFSRSSKKKKNSSEFRLIRLSRQLLIAHLMVLCIYCVWRTYWFYNIAWTQGDFLCKLYSYLTALPFHLWSNMVAAIAVDMLYCIVAPLSSVRNGNKRVSWLIGICWTFAIICSAPMAIFRGTVRIPDTEYEQCYPLVDNFDSNMLMGFHFFHVITTFYVPLIIILLCYFFIGCSLRNQMAKRKVLGSDSRRCGQNTTLRFVCATACIVMTFLLTWLPYQVMALLRVICEPNSNCELMVSNFSWLQALLISSTCINPFLYNFGIFKSRIRKKPNEKSTIGGYYGLNASTADNSGVGFTTNIGRQNSVRSAGTPTMTMAKRAKINMETKICGDDAYGSSSVCATPLMSLANGVNGAGGGNSNGRGLNSPNFSYRQPVSNCAFAKGVQADAFSTSN